jgi:hypothetical protein
MSVIMTTGQDQPSAGLGRAGAGACALGERAIKSSADHPPRGGGGFAYVYV